MSDGFVFAFKSPFASSRFSGKGILFHPVFLNGKGFRISDNKLFEALSSSIFQRK